jgi:hypothetical protein
VTVDEMLCRWAEQTYGIAGVVDVQFEMRDDGDYSELTPGDGPYMEVTITYLGKQGVGPQRHKRRERHYDTALVREILASTGTHGRAD